MKKRKCTVAVVVSILELVLLLGAYASIFAVPLIGKMDLNLKLPGKDKGGEEVVEPQETDFYTDAWENAEMPAEEPAEAIAYVCVGCGAGIADEMAVDCPVCGVNLVTGEAPTPVPVETPKPPVTIRLVSEEEAVAAIDAMGYMQLPVEDTWESSIVDQKGTHNNSASALVDNNIETSWQEGVDGDGLGESVALTMRDGVKVQYIAMHVGNWRTDDWFYRNNVPKAMDILAYDGAELFESGTVEFDEHRRVTYWVELSEPVEAKYLEFILRDVYKGSQYDDTCIAEITVYGGW